MGGRATIIPNMTDFNRITDHFAIEGTIESVKPLGNGLINTTYIVHTAESTTPDYVLQRINHHIFTDVDTLQRNIEAVTAHIRRKLKDAGETDIDRKVLTFIPAKGTLSGDDGSHASTYWHDGESYWRMMRYIPDAHTLEAVTPESSRYAGEAFGRFQSMLVDINANLHESIPDFHNMEFRLQQLREAVVADRAGRVAEVQPLIDEIESRADEMCFAERLHRDGRLPKRICHCDTKVNNMMFDSDGRILCVIDLDTVMPSYIFSDYGDFLRTGANTGAEDDPDLSHVEFDMDIFRAFTEGYLSTAAAFLSPLEIDYLPMAAAMFPYMQAVRFLADYINGDTYYKISYPDHNLVRTRAQLKLLHSIDTHMPEMRAFIASLR